MVFKRTLCYTEPIMMEELKVILEKYLNEETGNDHLKRAQKGTGGRKDRIRPVLLKGQLRFQAETFRGPKAFHENLTAEETKLRIPELLTEVYTQLQLTAGAGTVTVLVSKKGKVTVKEKKKVDKKADKKADKKVSLEHNKKKAYLLEEGKPVPFLVDLGVMTPEGRVVHARYDKFRQINRFLEFVEDTFRRCPGPEVTILDFGCGKSYLTFAIYYYLRECQGLDVRIIGLDLKEDVIRKCATLSKKYG